MLKIGYQGVSGAYSEIAALTYFAGKNTERIGYDTFAGVLDDVEKDTLDYAVIPVENTTTGMISRTYDLFRNYDINVVGEINVPISHNLIVIPGTTKEEIREVYSHPEALSQCGKFFTDNPQLKDVTYVDTAKAVAFVKKENDRSKAALASWLAAEQYGMEIIEKGVQDLRTNTTRFLVITKKKETVEGADKMSLMLVLKESPSDLFDVMHILSDSRLELTKLDSRPISGKNFTYDFYVDVRGDLKPECVQKALDQLKQRCAECRIFGCYKAACQG